MSTLWVAQYYILRAESLADLEPAAEILDWAHKHSLPSGVMPEQLDAYTGEPTSAMPLTWSHTSVIRTILEYLGRLRTLSA